MMQGQESSVERVRRAGAQFQALVIRLIAAVVVLVIFAGLAFLTYNGQVDDGALLLYAGVIVGYLVHATKESV